MSGCAVLMGPAGIQANQCVHLGDGLFPAFGRCLAPVSRNRKDLRELPAMPLSSAERTTCRSVSTLERFAQARAGYAAELEALLPTTRAAQACRQPPVPRRF